MKVSVQQFTGQFICKKKKMFFVWWGQGFYFQREVIGAFSGKYYTQIKIMSLSGLCPYLALWEIGAFGIKLQTICFRQWLVSACREQLFP